MQISQTDFLDGILGPGAITEMTGMLFKMARVCNMDQSLVQVSHGLLFIFNPLVKFLCTCSSIPPHCGVT